jgi:hypothetical protein
MEGKTFDNDAAASTVGDPADEALGDAVVAAGAVADAAERVEFDEVELPHAASTHAVAAAMNT